MVEPQAVRRRDRDEMRMTEAEWLQSPSRRRAIVKLAAFLAASPLAAAGQQDPRPIADERRFPGLDELLTSFEFEPVMHANVTRSVYNYTAHGDGSEFTLRRNREAFDWVQILAGEAIDPDRVNLATDVLGARMRFPIMVGPTAFQVPVHPDGEAGMRRAAAAADGTPFVLSHNSSIPVEKVAAAAEGVWWSQFYPQEDREIGRETLDRVQAAGCSAVVITVDQQASYYERSQRTRNLGGSPRGPAPPRGAAGRGGAARPPAGIARYRVTSPRLWYTWDYLDEVRKLIRVPILLKGILTHEDARLAVERGVDGIIVSNHGGRSMDYGPATLEVLPEIVDAVGGRIPVLTDSGYRRGTDVLKALALGANAVLLGRVTRWGLGAYGAPGAQRVIEIVQRELVAAAAAAGRPTLASIDRSLVRTRFP
jgi:isopentenyl diphosphate isomerase/L-lactate dehydrogenase-like FMN-dependent dehydrogenase